MRLDLPTNHHPEPTTMNRQIIPSMILSVLIVCFFSIVLYERDKPGALARPSGGDDAPAATSAAAPKGPDTSKVVDEVPQREIKGLAKTETPPASTADQHVQSSPAAGLEKAKPVRVA